MQYVRMAISYSATHPADVVRATEDTSARKLREMRYAMQVEKELSKDQILERYLNIAPFGNAPTASGPPARSTSANSRRT